MTLAEVFEVNGPGVYRRSHWRGTLVYVFGWYGQFLVGMRFGVMADRAWEWGRVGGQEQKGWEFVGADYVGDSGPVVDGLIGCGAFDQFASCVA